MGWFQRLFKIKPRKVCENCGSKNTAEGYYTRGYNNWCEQAAGDKGAYCHNCSHVTFDQSFEEYKSKLPDWVTPYKQKKDKQITE